jgi:hypothetical protein
MNKTKIKLSFKEIEHNKKRGRVRVRERERERMIELIWKSTSSDCCVADSTVVTAFFTIPSTSTMDSRGILQNSFFTELRFWKILLKVLRK